MEVSVTVRNMESSPQPGYTTITHGRALSPPSWQEEQDVGTFLLPPPE